MSTVQYATFEVADRLFGLEVERVQEVLSFSEYTPVPLAPGYVGGLFNLRGQVIAALDMRVRLGLPPTDLSAGAMNVIIRTEDESVSLLVDHIGDVVELDDRHAEPLPDTLMGPVRSLITATFPLTDRLMLVLDAERAVDSANHD
ncbi:chemotaxis protein CheW [Saccharothrix violaceirubra]|uniref:Purine-binding chemotaxis protein CheW n=1 Tax=Saccharothrix violaceirubra TaxID=413306 RepID=A0A7W7T8B1_9PSEU|nr:chemotaxis protein CheW [Saccharothrix violaceirubra]MBB4968391.1 purine-binding chemotaxis protein CheW [Saccharothrix violaceirubra]